MKIRVKTRGHEYDVIFSKDARGELRWEDLLEPEKRKEPHRRVSSAISRHH